MRLKRGFNTSLTFNKFDLASSAPMAEMEKQRSLEKMMHTRFIKREEQYGELRAAGYEHPERLREHLDEMHWNSVQTEREPSPGKRRMNTSRAFAGTKGDIYGATD